MIALAAFAVGVLIGILINRRSKTMNADQLLIAALLSAIEEEEGVTPTATRNLLNKVRSGGVSVEAPAPHPAGPFVSAVTMATGFALYFQSTADATLTIDWGDGSALEYWYTAANEVSPTHNYADTSSKDVFIWCDDFGLLERFHCYSNSLTALDVSACTALIVLNCYSNSLTTLDVSACTALIVLNCYSNSLTTLDVSANTALFTLDCYSNSLTTLDVSACTALIYLDCNSNSLTTLDVSANTALLILHCYSNSLTALDVSANTALTYLDCYSNSLTALDVSANTVLQYLDCNSNSLTTLDVSANTALFTLSCYSNSLTTLDVSACTALIVLNCYSNSLTTLDVSANTALLTLFCFNNSFNSTAVDNVLVDVEAYSTNYGYLFIWGNAAPTATGLTAQTTLIGRNWNVITELDAPVTALPFTETYETNPGYDQSWGLTYIPVDANPDSSIPGGISGWGSECLFFGDDFYEGLIRHDLSSSLNLTFQFYLASGGAIDIYAGDELGSYYPGRFVTLECFTSGGVLNLFLNGVVDTYAVSDTTKYKVEIFWNQLTGDWSWKVDNVSAGSGTTATSAYEFAQVLVTGFSAYVDNVNVNTV